MTDNKALPPVRRAHLASYLRELIKDVAAEGKVAKIEGNPVEVAAVAIMSGSLALGETLWKDIASFASDAKEQARVVGRPMVEQAVSNLVARGIGALANKLLGPK